ncbi:hypothetical protein IAU59_003691 [Kwoniella sp. CBS 9459]
MPIKIPTSDTSRVDDGQRLMETMQVAGGGPTEGIKVGSQYFVHRAGTGHTPRPANILDSRVGKSGLREYYISFVGQDKRLDAWVSNSEVFERVSVSDGAGDETLKALIAQQDTPATPQTMIASNVAGPSTPSTPASTAERTSRRQDIPASTASTPEREHAAMTRVRNFEDVRFGEYLVKTWYYSPYPLPVDDPHHNASPTVNNLSTPLSTSSRIMKRADSPSTSKKRKLNPTTSTPHQSTSQHADGQAETPSRLRPIASSRSVSEMFSGVGKGGEGARGRLWVCDLCFKYMRTRAAWDRHSNSCTMLQPPGRRVYQRGSYTIWEIDGAQATLYCQNLSLFGKLFIDHKSVFFHVENFLFYVLCDAATSKRDQVMAFFSKEKLSYDDYNLACIVTFPPHQNRGFGKLLIEFSYYLTLHPSTRPTNQSPGTPERPLSDLGLKGYTAYWVSVILRFLRGLLEDVEPFISTESPRKSPVKPVPAVSGGTSSEARSLRVRKAPSVATEARPKGETVLVNDVEFSKLPVPGYRGQQRINMTLKEISRGCHLRTDDVAFTLSELGFLNYRRNVQYHTNGISSQLRNGGSHGLSSSSSTHGLARNPHAHAGDRDDESDYGDGQSDNTKADHGIDLGEWKDIEVVITRGMVDEAAAKWRVKDKGVLEEKYVLL